MIKKSSIIKRIIERAAETPSDAAVILGDHTLKYVVLMERAGRAASAIARSVSGVSPRVCYFGKTSFEYYELFMASLMRGGVFIPINWRFAPAEAVGVISDADADIIVVEPEFFAIANALIASGMQASKILITGDGASAELESYEAWIDAGDSLSSVEETSEDAICLQLYTSGTTGEPKGVQLSHRAFVSQFDLFDKLPESGRFAKGDVLFICLPGFHVVGAAYILQGLFRGATAVIQRDFNPLEAGVLIERCNVTHTILVPTIIGMIIDAAKKSQLNLSSLRCVFYGAAPISRNLMQEALALLSCDMFQAYGLTETAGLVTLLPPEDHTADSGARLESAGFAAPGVEIRIVDGAGAVCPTGDIGEVIIRTPTLMSGYWKKPEVTEDAVKDGWFYTGDAGLVDEDGYLFLKDRQKDMIISGGENIYPAEIERVLATCPGVADATVIGIPDEKWGESVLAVIVSTNGADISEQSVQEYLRERLAGFKVPKRVEFRSSLPRNHLGKILKKEVRAPYWRDKVRQIS
ncbi:MAG: long-chain-fatty-acid--CoA ligase [Pseudomonadota bacterium]